jgi:FAD/FMN-containing dehydrogenase
MDLHNRLSRNIHPPRVLTSYLHCIAYASDASYFRLIPQAVVQPESISEIQALFQFTQQNQIPMTFRAAGTSLSGQAVTDGGYYSSNIPCEIGMSEATGKDYTSIVYLVEKASRQGHSDV